MYCGSGHRSDEEVWVEAWLKQIGKAPVTQIKVTAKRSIPLHVAKHHLRNSLLILSKLQSKSDDLQKNVHTLTASEWEHKFAEINCLQNEYTALMSNIDDPDILQLLRKSVHNRKKKRQRQKRQKEERKSAATLERNEREKLHKDIDQWLLNMKEAVERTKTEEKMKKEADSVLSEVTKKKSDARKQLSLLTSLIKLRNIREHMAVQRGENVSLEDANAFAKVTEQLTKTWEKLLQVYTKEEQGLKVMLEQSATEDSNSIRLEKEKKTAAEWTDVLFGPRVVPSDAYYALTAAERDFERFLDVRRGWDRFVNEEGSRIPVGWVLPGADARDEWRKYVVINN